MKRSLCCPFQVSFSPFSCSPCYSPSELYTFRINRRGSCWHEDDDYSDRIGKLCGGCCNSSNHVPFDFDAGVFWGLIYVCSFGRSLVPMSPRVFNPTPVNTHTHIHSHRARQCRVRRDALSLPPPTIYTIRHSSDYSRRKELEREGQ